MKTTNENSKELQEGSGQPYEVIRENDNRDGSTIKTAKGEDRRLKELEKLLKRKKYPNWLDLLAIVGIFIAGNFVAFLVIAIVNLFGYIEATAATALSYLVMFLTTIIGVVFLQRSRGLKKNMIKLNAKGVNFPLLLWGLLLVIVTGVVIEPLLALFPMEYLDSLYKAIGRGGWAILTTVVFAAVLEEMLFRGLILEAIREKSGAFTAVLLSALIFGIIHIIPQQVVNAFFIGIILGYIYIKTNSLLAVMIIHALNNGIAYIQMELLGSKVNLPFRELIGNDTWYYIIYAVSVIFLILGIVGITKTFKRANPDKTELKGAA